ncbi:PAS domain-containing protein [Lactococcus nasutitermitis]|uniref:PAS domain-containing protein n=1 Tax=Lactococcus nasutitermitis TaxID=1652957 RepID=A0ABV9JGR6_9LACT|nr:PAS domain-containing protein [Lactococcus nasutitermitis]
MSEEIKVVSPEAVIQFPTGTIKASTLNLMLKKISFELGYCDENNRFRWFSDKPNRLRARRIETIGEPVLQLHPRIADKVERLLNSFEKGEMDSWVLRFPNPAGEPNKGYKKFIAVYDDEQHYLGSMDATVDIAIFEGKTGKRTPDTLPEFPTEKGKLDIREEKVAGPSEVVGTDVVIDFPTGAIKASTLDTILKLCPFEMGFCDAEDNFRWYTDNPKRVHHRRTSAIGESVLKLHPKVAHHVEKLLEDFHAGTKDEWEFWFPKRDGSQGQMYQKFMAVRDEETGEYLGCMDITVNIDQFFSEEELAAMNLGPKTGMGDHPAGHPEAGKK